MTFYYVNFRGNSAGPTGFPGDSANNSYDIGEASAGHTRTFGVQAWKFGWRSTNTGSASNKPDYATFEHFGGRVGSTGGVEWDLINLVAGHVYNIRVALGAIDSGPGNYGFSIYDSNDTTKLWDKSLGAVPVDQFMDAQGILRTSATDWNNNNQYCTVTATSTSLHFYRGVSPNAYNPYYCTIGVEDATADGTIGGGGGSTAKRRLLLGIG